MDFILTIGVKVPEKNREEKRQRQKTARLETEVMHKPQLLFQWRYSEQLRQDRGRDPCGKGGHENHSKATEPEVICMAPEISKAKQVLVERL